MFEIERVLVLVLEGLALPCASHFSEIALAGTCCLRSTFAIVQVRATHAVVAV